MCVLKFKFNKSDDKMNHWDKVLKSYKYWKLLTVKEELLEVKEIGFLSTYCVFISNKCDLSCGKENFPPCTLLIKKSISLLLHSQCQR